MSEIETRTFSDLWCARCWEPYKKTEVDQDCPRCGTELEPLVIVAAKPPDDDISFPSVLTYLKDLEDCYSWKRKIKTDEVAGKVAKDLVSKRINYLVTPLDNDVWEFEVYGGHAKILDKAIEDFGTERCQHCSHPLPEGWKIKRCGRLICPGSDVVYCECDLRVRSWNPITGRCQTCKCKYQKV